MRVTREEIRRLFGEIDAHLAAEIETSGVTPADLEAVAARLAMADEALGEDARPLGGRALRIYEALRRDEDRRARDV